MYSDPLIQTYPLRVREVALGVIIFISLLFYMFPKFLGESKRISTTIQEEIESMGAGVIMSSNNQFETDIKATQKATKIKEGANDYADYVLANLQLTLTKMQKNLIHLEKNIESGRQILSKQKQYVIEEGV